MFGTNWMETNWISRASGKMVTVVSTTPMNVVYVTESGKTKRMYKDAFVRNFDLKK